MSPSRSLLAAVVALALAAGPAGAQSTTPGTAATSPSASTQPEITAEQAGNGLLLDAADRVELAQALADATEESGVCFGYEVQISGAPEVLSNAGPDRTPDAQDCPKGSMELQVDILYTAESSESEDSASFRIATDVPGQTGSVLTQRLKDLSGVDEDDFLGDEDDLALRNATAALPLLLDDATPAELPAPSTSASAPNGDRLTGSPASDWLRAHGVGIGIAFAVLVLALVLLVGGLVGRRQAGQPKRPSGSTGPPSGTSSSTTTP